MVRRVCFAVVVGMAASSVFAGVGRHDRPDSLYESIGNLSSFASVGQFTGTSGGGGFAASGTLIAPDVVLTAAHVVDSASSLSFSIGGSQYQASSWVFHENWDSSNILGGSDIALVKLSAPVLNVATASLFDGPSVVGRQSVAVGYGLGGDGLTGFDPNSDLIKRGGTNTIDASLNGILLQDFDAPKIGRRASSATSAEYLIAPGDSGGALFVFDNGWKVAGVHSFGLGLDGDPDSDYGDWSGHTSVIDFDQWIDSNLLALSDVPLASSSARLNRNSSFARGFAVEVPTPTSALMMVGLSICALARRGRRA